jgi:hypothetical protein
LVALKLKDDMDHLSPDNYENNELVPYAEAQNSSNPRPYIAAVLTPSDGKRNFTLGDGRITNTRLSQIRKSTKIEYLNGPLQPGSEYRIFQRIMIDNKVCMAFGD